MILRYHEAAEQELLEGIDFLEQRSPGLGRRFLADVTHAEERILAFPAAGVEIRTLIRRQLLRKFPYSLIYAIEADLATVLAVAHHRRRPFYWQTRNRA